MIFKNIENLKITKKNPDNSKSFVEKLIKEPVDKILLKDFSKNQSLASPDGSKKEIEGSLDMNNMPNNRFNQDKNLN